MPELWRAGAAGQVLDCGQEGSRLLPSMGAYPSADTQDLSPIEAETSAYVQGHPGPHVRPCLNRTKGIFDGRSYP